MKTLAELLPTLPGARAVGRIASPIERVHSDTRSLRAGDSGKQFGELLCGDLQHRKPPSVRVYVCVGW